MHKTKIQIALGVCVNILINKLTLQVSKKNQQTNKKQKEPSTQIYLGSSKIGVGILCLSSSGIEFSPSEVSISSDLFLGLDLQNLGIHLSQCSSADSFSPSSECTIRVSTVFSFVLCLVDSVVRLSSTNANGT